MNAKCSMNAKYNRNAKCVCDEILALNKWRWEGVESRRGAVVKGYKFESQHVSGEGSSPAGSIS